MLSRQLKCRLPNYQVGDKIYMQSVRTNEYYEVDEKLLQQVFDGYAGTGYLFDVFIMRNDEVVDYYGTMVKKIEKMVLDSVVKALVKAK